MNVKAWTATLALMALASVPAAGQQMPMAGHGQNGAAMGSGMMQMCHSMMGGGGMMGGSGMMGGHGSMMGSGGAMGSEGMMGARGMMGGSGMMGGMGMAASPSALLSAAEPLGLTADQKTKLEDLAKAAAGDHQTHLQAAAAAREKAASTLQDENPNVDAYAAALQEAASHMVQAHVALTRASLDARAVLTPEQQAKVKDGTALVGSMMCGMMGQRGMMGGS